MSTSNELKIIELEIERLLVSATLSPLSGDDIRKFTDLVKSKVLLTQKMEVADEPSGLEDTDPEVLKQMLRLVDNTKKTVGSSE